MAIFNHRDFLLILHQFVLNGGSATKFHCDKNSLQAALLLMSCDLSAFLFLQHLLTDYCYLHVYYHVMATMLNAECQQSKHCCSEFLNY